MIIEPEDIKEDVRTLLKRKNSVIQIENDSVMVDLGTGHPYEIPLNDVNSDSDILRWVLQICSKKGADVVVIESFIRKLQSHQHS